MCIRDRGFDEQTNLLVHKGVYPYEYVDSINRFNETSLPAREHFDNRLMESSISVSYTHLDVYKRQGLSVEGLKQNKKIPPFVRDIAKVDIFRKRGVVDAGAIYTFIFNSGFLATIFFYRSCFICSHHRANKVFSHPFGIYFSVFQSLTNARKRKP